MTPVNGLSLQTGSTPEPLNRPVTSSRVKVAHLLRQKERVASTKAFVAVRYVDRLACGMIMTLKE
jgi:hypothetical protein